MDFCRIIATVDPKVAIPRMIVNFAIRKLAGLLLYCIQTQAQYVQKNQKCAHACRISENRDFYELWLMPKLVTFCQHKGWELPSITYFDREHDSDEFQDATQGGPEFEGDMPPGQEAALST